MYYKKVLQNLFMAVFMALLCSAVQVRSLQSVCISHTCVFYSCFTQIPYPLHCMDEPPYCPSPSLPTTLFRALGYVNQDLLNNIRSLAIFTVFCIPDRKGDQIEVKTFSPIGYSLSVSKSEAFTGQYGKRSPHVILDNPQWNATIHTTQRNVNGIKGRELVTLLGALARLHVDFVVRDDLVFLKSKCDVVDLIRLDTLKFCVIHI